MQTPYAIVPSSFGGFWLYPGAMISLGAELANRRHFDTRAEAEAVRERIIGEAERAIADGQEKLAQIAAMKAKGY